MRHLISVIIAISVLLPQTVYARNNVWSGWGKVENILIAGKWLIINHSSPCADCGPDWAGEYTIDPESPGGKAILSLALAALMSNNEVRIFSDIDDDSQHPRCIIMYFDMKK